MEKQNPIVHVGILKGKSISFAFNNNYHTEDGTAYAGVCHAVLCDNKVAFNGNMYDRLLFSPESGEASFELKNVTIGIAFHWEQKEDQRFHGALELVVDNGEIVAINHIPAEKYLLSVISSEMSPQASKEFLKAHAVISRTWLLCRIREKQGCTGKKYHFTDNEFTRIRWNDREEHKLFDICADDHCQRYQGISRTNNRSAEEAVQETEGEVLTYGGNLCDTRFSKCCGGITEEFEFCWDNEHFPYLSSVRDTKKHEPLPDLTKEEEAAKWIKSSPDSFCNTTDQHILKQILNHYDQKTTDFYRWTVSYTQEELSKLIQEKSGLYFGEIIDLIPIRRGHSGRIELLRIEGTHLSYIIGKELEIRKILSPSHLYSSAFIVEKENIRNGIPGRFKLIGAGWGHGVGLCQIGAAIMSEQGFDYKAILAHYYRNSSLEKIY